MVRDNKTKAKAIAVAVIIIIGVALMTFSALYEPQSTAANCVEMADVFVDIDHDGDIDLLVRGCVTINGSAAGGVITSPPVAVPDAGASVPDPTFAP